jgi:hypothetical protein
MGRVYLNMSDAMYGNVNPHSCMGILPLCCLYRPVEYPLDCVVGFR